MRYVLAVVATAAMLVSAPAQAAPCAGFTDVDDTSPFCGSIAWMKNRGITLGCTSTTLYCPGDPVRRDQMAAFMKRLADALFPLTCSAGQIMKWNGADWACANDNAGVGGGTVTSVAAGTGLQGSPNPITTTGAINLAPSYQLPQGCSNGQVAKSNGSGGWTCATDTAGTGTVTSVTAGTGLTGGTITGSGTIAADTNYLQRRVSASCAAGSSIRAIAADGTVTCETDDVGSANAYVQGGNAYGTTAVLGTTDNQPLDIRVNGSRVMRYEPNPISPNVIGGNPNNSATAGVRGATIAGGGVASGDSDPILPQGAPNRVTDHYGTVGGGFGNRAGSDDAALTNALFATAGGGYNNTASGSQSTIAGGTRNTASGGNGTVAGGAFNTASGSSSTVGGGQLNTASGDSGTVAGGSSNTASGVFSTVAGGSNNTASGDFSFAAGHRAKATTPGTFMWADSRDFDFQPSVANFFGVRATGGIGLTVAINGTTGAVTQFCNYLPGYSGWSCTSDRNAKENFASVDGSEILDKLMAMPVYTYNFKGADPALRMLGPTAQDFHAAFGLGDSETTIASGNLHGVALAAIQGLNAKLGAKDAEIVALRSESDALKREVADLRSSHQKEIADLRLAVEVLMTRSAGEGRVAQTR